MWDIYDSHCDMLPQIPLTLLVALLGRNWSSVTRKIIISSAPGQSHVNELNYLVSDLIDKLVAKIVTQKQWKRKCFFFLKCAMLSHSRSSQFYMLLVYWLLMNDWITAFLRCKTGILLLFIFYTIGYKMRMASLYYSLWAFHMAADISRPYIMWLPKIQHFLYTYLWSIHWDICNLNCFYIFLVFPD